MRRGYVDTSLGQVHYRESGQGPVLLLLHQTAESSRMYTDVMPLLARDFRVIATDTPGFGESDKPDAPPSMADYARCMFEALERLDVRTASILGHHTGASIAVEMAASRPDRVQKLVLSGCPDYDPEVRAEKLKNVAPASLAADGSHFAKAWARVAPYRTGWATTEQTDRAAQDTLKAGPNYYFAYVAVFSYDVRARIPAITAPTLLIGGETDTLTARLPLIQPLFRKAELHVFKGSGSLPLNEIPQAFADRVAAFLIAP